METAEQARIEAVREMIVTSSRTPDERAGDLDAQWGANVVGVQRLTEMAGAPLDLDLKSRVEKEFGLSLLNGYGITECSPGMSPAACER